MYIRRWREFRESDNYMEGFLLVSCFIEDINPTGFVDTVVPNVSLEGIREREVRQMFGM